MHPHTKAPAVSDAEIAWVLAQHPPLLDPTQLAVDYGDEAEAMRAAFQAACPELLPLLGCPGVATRWRQFLEWLPGCETPFAPEAVFAAYARSLGRLTSYRALALSDDAYQRLRAADTILVTGRLKASADEVRTYLRSLGLRRAIDLRMREIGALQYDPSLSLHDHPETAVSVAAGALRSPDRRVYRFEIELPVIEVLGWRMCDVNGWVGWFRHRGLWHDPTNPRTERFVLDAIPRLSERLRTERVFQDAAEIDAYLRPFAEEQAWLRQRLTYPQHPTPHT